MKSLGLVALITTLVLMTGAAAAYGVEGAVTDESQTEEQKEECEAMMSEMDDCSMADRGMMGMMHNDDMMGMMHNDDMMGEMHNDDMMEECQTMMDSMDDDSSMMG